MQPAQTRKHDKLFFRLGAKTPLDQPKRKPGPNAGRLPVIKAAPGKSQP